MKKLALVLITLLSVQNLIFSQASPQAQQDQKKGSWHKQSPQSGLYGIDLDGAKELLKNKEIKKTPIIAIIGSGMDIEHEALKHAIWVNPKEQNNGVDDDKNGFIDDFNGWNFISNKEGEEITNTLNNADREWLRMKDKYADIIFDNKEYYTYKNGVKEIVSAPTDMKEYKYFKELLLSQNTNIGSIYAGYVTSKDLEKYVIKWDEMLDKAYPNRNRLGFTLQDLKNTVLYEGAPADSIRDVSLSLVYMYMGMLKEYVQEDGYWIKTYENFTGKQEQVSLEAYNKAIERNDIEQRQRVIGDNIYDIKDTNYGTNQLLTSNSTSSTAFSGIIAGYNDENGFSGIIPESKIMTLVTNSVKGEPYIKDLVLSIRYAVDNEADVILLPQQSLLYTPTEIKWMHDALKYADKKGALVVVPVMQYSVNMDDKAYYPSTEMLPKAKLKNLITVACSDSLGNPSINTNYGAKGIDLFAPGALIYTTIPGDMYAMGSSPSLGAVVTVASAALIKAYFPKMKPADLKKHLMNNVTDLKDREVDITIKVKSKSSQEQFLYSQVSASGGVLNLKNTIKAILKK